MPRFSAIFATLFVLALTPAAAQPANLLQNGDFQTGSFAAWSLNAGYTGVLNQPFDGFTAQNGATYAILGPIGGNGTLTQSFTDTPGGQLAISFNLASDGGLPNDFIAAFDNAPLLALTEIPAGDWITYSFDVAATGTDTLSFAFRDDPGYLALDGVSVTEIPEPGTAALVVAGLATAAAARFALKRRVCPAAPPRTGHSPSAN